MTTSQEGGSTSTGGRESWVDLTKGIAILLVVLMHAQGLLAGHGITGAGWTAAMDALGTLRMPTFFLVSGLFAHRSFAVPARVFRRRKVWTFLWVYALWSVLHVAVFGLVGLAYHDPAALRRAGQWASETLTVNSGLWYLVALPVFFAVARRLRGVPVRAQVVGAAVVSLAFSSGAVSTGQWGPDHMAAYLVYFLTGCYASEAVRAAAVRARWRTVAALGLAWVGLSVAFAVAHLPGAGHAVLPLLAVPFALTSATLLARRGWGAPLERLGRHTLPVYVMHFAAVSLVVLAVRGAHLVAPGTAAAAVLPVVVTVLAVVVVLGARPLVTRLAPWSLALPGRGGERSAAGGRHRRRARPPGPPPWGQPA